MNPRAAAKGALRREPGGQRPMGPIDIRRLLSVNVYHWIVSVYGNVEGLRFFVAFSLPSLLKAGPDSPACIPTPGLFSYPRAVGREAPASFSALGPAAGARGAAPLFRRLFRSCKAMAFRQS